MKPTLSLLKPIVRFSVFLYPFILVLYLILFSLENVFPGFVSINFNLNYYLLLILLIGFITAFNHETEIKQTTDEMGKTILWNAIFIAGLVILSFVIIQYKTADLGWVGFIISIISSFLIVIVSLIIILPPENISSVHEHHLKLKLHYTKLFRSSVGLTLVGFIIIIITGGFVYSIYQGKKTEQLRTIAMSQQEIANQQQTLTIIQRPPVEIPDEQLLQNTLVFVKNGSGETGKAASMAAFLKSNNFGNIKTGDATNSGYINADIQFNESDSELASYIYSLITDNEKYKVVNMMPLTTASQSGTILILGK